MLHSYHSMKNIDGRSSEIDCDLGKMIITDKDISWASLQLAASTKVGVDTSIGTIDSYKSMVFYFTSSVLVLILLTSKECLVQ